MPCHSKIVRENVHSNPKVYAKPKQIQILNPCLMPAGLPNGAPARHFSENWREINILGALKEMARVWRVFEISHLLLKLPICTKFYKIII